MAGEERRMCGRTDRDNGRKSPEKKIKSIPKSVSHHWKFKKSQKEAQTWTTHHVSPEKQEFLFFILFSLTLSLLHKSFPDN